MKHNLFNSLFDAVLSDLDKRGHILRHGTIVAATIVSAARRYYKQNKINDSDPSPPELHDCDEQGKSTSSRMDSQQDHDATVTKKR